MAEEAKPTPRKKGGKKRERREVRTGIAHIQATFNNTIVTLTDRMGNVVSWSSAGSAGFKGSRKSTPFAAQTASEFAARKAMEYGLKQIEVFVRGPGRSEEHTSELQSRLHIVCSLLLEKKNLSEILRTIIVDTNS